jgi:hypothetical protein
MLKTRGEMAEYFTLHSAKPLRVLPNMGIMYFAQVNMYNGWQMKGYFVKSSQYKDVEMQMATEIENGGNLSFFTLSSGRLALKVTDAGGAVKICNTMWEFKWEKLITALSTIQTFARSWLIRHRLKNGKSTLKILKEFKSCIIERGVLPYDIVMDIVRISADSMNSPEKLSMCAVDKKYQLRRIETNSFAEIYATSD